MLGFPPLVCELLAFYSVLCALTLAQLVHSLHRHRQAVSFHSGFLGLTLLWGLDRLLLWTAPQPLAAPCSQDLLNGVSTLLHCATYSLFVLFLANLAAPLDRAATPLCRGGGAGGAQARPLTSPSSVAGAGGVFSGAGSVPESDVAESPYLGGYLGPRSCAPHAAPRERARGGPLEDRTWRHPAARRHLNTAAYGTFNAAVAAGLLTLYLTRGCGTDGATLGAVQRAVCAGLDLLFIGLLVYYCYRLLPHEGTERIQLLAYIAIGACLARGLWHVASQWLPPAYSEDILVRPGAKAPSRFQGLAAALLDAPLWAALAVFGRDPQRPPPRASGSVAIHPQQEVPFFPSSSYGATHLKGPDPPTGAKPSGVLAAAAATGPIHQHFPPAEHHWNGSVSTFDSLDAESYLPTSLTGARLGALGPA